MDKSFVKGVSLHRLLVFIEVCKTLHIGRAAERLEIAQPSLSAQIKALENVLDVRLFNRRNRAIDLTDAGKQLKDEAEALLNAHEHAVQNVINIARGEMGRLSLGFVGSALAEEQVARQLNSLHQHFPSSQIKLHEMNCQAAMTALIHNEVDLVILRAPAELPDFMKYRVLSSSRLVVIMPQDHVLAEKETVSIRDLGQHAIIGYPTVDDNYGIAPLIEGLAKINGVALDVQWRITTVAGVVNMVASGTGIGIVPEQVAERSRSSITFRHFEEHVESELWLVWHERRTSGLLHRFLKTMESNVNV